MTRGTGNVEQVWTIRTVSECLRVYQLTYQVVHFLAAPVFVITLHKVAQIARFLPAL